jgi:histone acetyltransferase (RNA polymerase elongator complex component)
LSKPLALTICLLCRGNTDFFSCVAAGCEEEEADDDEQQQYHDFEQVAREMSKIIAMTCSLVVV